MIHYACLLGIIILLLSGLIYILSSCDKETPPTGADRLVSLTINLLEKPAAFP
jgi:hypothetical protein